MQFVDSLDDGLVDVTIDTHDLVVYAYVVGDDDHRDRCILEAAEVFGLRPVILRLDQGASA